ncbi:MAG: biotin/lipoyl-binding protein [Xanthomonadales bacterium]|nr:biotin/lipoyl-binding protein [Xanthomonadales bacterium]NIN58885.1 biotin/lipoyl-binding protein [Xanthomonadales bacterium]NIN74154.1 biotin/lipoyl-binding protein [Xanthomonadales bacterium]NIO13825.1 biotin/lipoyl-binding protein [Xanthomonadales bacterium]NIP11278.1 biotin/lipoyl-binding protein [Xanthomonadales bacterium]
MTTVVLKIPKAAVSMQTGTVERWLVEDGARVTRGQPIYNLEIEKSLVEVEAPASGILRHKAAAGESFAVGEVIGEIIGE